MRAERVPVVGDGRDRLSLLDRRERVVALADARRDRVAQIPFAMLLAIILARESLAFPRARRQHAGQLALDVDAGLASKAELRQEIVRHVDVAVGSEHVIVRVAGDDDRLGHVDVPVPALLVVVEPVRAARDLEEARIEDRLRRRALARRERGERKEGLDRRARRIRTAQRPVQQRYVGGIVERVPARGIDALDEQIRIEPGLGYEGQHLAVGRVDRDERAAPIAERGFDRLLQLDVERKPEIIARCRRSAR